MIRLPCSNLLTGADARDAVSLAMAGSHEEALQALERALDEARESADLLRVAGVLGAMALVLERLGRGGEAQARVQAAISLCRANREPVGEAAYMGVLAELQATSGRIQPARNALDLAELSLREKEAWTELGSLLVRRAVVETLAGDPVMAMAALADAAEVCATEAVYAEIDLAVASLHVSQELAEVA